MRVSCKLTLTQTRHIPRTTRHTLTRTVERIDRTRAINRGQQGDLGEASAIEWFSRLGATILIPFGHSPDYDLVIELDGRLLRVQVKTSTLLTPTPNGHYRCQVSLKTCGGIRAGPA